MMQDLPSDKSLWTDQENIDSDEEIPTEYCSIEN